MRRLSLFLGLGLLTGCAGGHPGKYIVFFTQNSVQIDAPAQTVISQAAQRAVAHHASVRVEATRRPVTTCRLMNSWPSTAPRSWRASLPLMAWTRPASASSRAGRSIMKTVRSPPAVSKSWLAETDYRPRLFEHDRAGRSVTQPA